MLAGTRTAAVALLLASRSGAVMGQVAKQFVTVPATADCRSCEIRIGAPHRVIGSEPKGLDLRPSDIALDSRGRAFIMQAAASGMPLVAGTEGAPLTELGRVGAGPGEFRRAIWVTVTPHDTIYFFDQGNGRITVYDPSLRYVRSALAPMHTYGMAWFPSPPELVLNAHVADRARVGLAFHLFDQIGNQLRSFGAVEAVVRPEAPGQAVRRKIAVDGPNNLLAVTWIGPYELERWSLGGELQERFRIDSPGRPPVNGNRPRPELPPPEPTAQAVARDSIGLVWILTRVADDDWRRGIQATAVAEGGWEVKNIDPTRYHDTMVEVFDLKRGLLLARRRIDDSCRAITQWWELVREAQNSDGSYRLEFRRAQFVRSR